MPQFLAAAYGSQANIVCGGRTGETVAKKRAEKLPQIFAQILAILISCTIFKNVRETGFINDKLRVLALLIRTLTRYKSGGARCKIHHLLSNLKSVYISDGSNSCYLTCQR